MTPSNNSFTISAHNLALLHSTLLHSYPVPLTEIYLNLPKLTISTPVLTMQHSKCPSYKAKKKNVYVALSRPTVKCEKTGSGFFFFFFFFFMSDLGEEFAKICIQWLKKALA